MFYYVHYRIPGHSVDKFGITHHFKACRYYCEADTEEDAKEKCVANIPSVTQVDFVFESKVPIEIYEKAIEYSNDPKCPNSYAAFIAYIAGALNERQRLHKPIKEKIFNDNLIL